MDKLITQLKLIAVFSTAVALFYLINAGDYIIAVVLFVLSYINLAVIKTIEEIKL